MLLIPYPFSRGRPLRGGGETFSVFASSFRRGLIVLVITQQRDALRTPCSWRGLPIHFVIIVVQLVVQLRGIEHPPHTRMIDKVLSIIGRVGSAWSSSPASRITVVAAHSDTGSHLPGTRGFTRVANSDNICRAHGGNCGSSVARLLNHDARQGNIIKQALRGR